MMLSLAPIDTGAAERTFPALKCVDLDAAIDIATWSGYPFVRGRAHQSRDQRDGPRPERVGPYRKNRYLMSAAAPRTSTMTASRTIRLNAQFQTIYVSWSIMSAITYLSPLHIHHRNYAPPFLRISLRAPRALIAFMLAIARVQPRLLQCLNPDWRRTPLVADDIGARAAPLMSRGIRRARPPLHPTRIRRQKFLVERADVVVFFCAWIAERVESAENRLVGNIAKDETQVASG